MRCHAEEYAVESLFELGLAHDAVNLREIEACRQAVLIAFEGFTPCENGVPPLPFLIECLAQCALCEEHHALVGLHRLHRQFKVADAFVERIECETYFAEAVEASRALVTVDFCRALQVGPRLGKLLEADVTHADRIIDIVCGIAQGEQPFVGWQRTDVVVLEVVAVGKLQQHGEIRRIALAVSLSQGIRTLRQIHLVHVIDACDFSRHLCVKGILPQQQLAPAQLG